MKVYTRVVIDMATGETVEEESHEYSGPVDKCKGGGSTNTVDKEYNRRMANIAEEQQGTYEQMMNFYKHGTFESPGASQEAINRQADALVSKTGGGKHQIGSTGSYPGMAGGGPIYTRTPTKYQVEGVDQSFDSQSDALEAARQKVSSAPEQYGISTEPSYSGPSYADMEREQIAANMELIPEQTAFQKESLGAQRELLPQQTALQKEQMGLSSAQIEEQESMIEGRKPIIGEYYQEALQTPDRDQYANRFGSDVAAQFSDRQRQQDIQMGALGADPGSTRSSARRNANMADRALAVASGKQQGRDYADEMRFRRLGSALGR